MIVVVHQVRSTTNGIPDEVSRECQWEALPAVLSEMAEACTNWVSFNIVPRDDFASLPLALQRVEPLTETVVEQLP